ncbi:UbiA prenyltransferase family protein [Sphingobacterium corticibacterium]|uniref:Prenyltransferase n=1 Tax=Sphingobacterium corticibacterium TaxID=2484746 RepID=A0A4Q6XFF9_9SPHI|nr:hypothetical protein [Sphingobacterium corticibacterium]RZF58163.1 hypothetical protein EWE74_19115 [Sphingobacterium corticibacterium]
MKLLKQVYYFLIYTNLLIAGAAIAQSALTYLFFDAPFDYPIMMIEGAATLLLYNFSMLLSKPREPEKSAYRRTRWIFRNEWLLWLNGGIGIVVLGYAAWHIHLYSLFFLIGIGAMSVAYSIPIIPYKGKWVGFRQLPGMKIFHIAFIWTLSSVCLPVFEMHLDGLGVDLQLFQTLFVLKFIFLLICTLPFDIRDIQQDSYYHLKTIPNMLGANRAILLCYALLIVHSGIVLLFDIQLKVQMGILTTNLFIAIVLKQVVFRNANRYHYAFLLDFALIAQFLIVYLFV